MTRIAPGPMLLWISILGSSALAEETPEGKALAYLAREVPRWSSENHCYSCHNNGDAARALYAATMQGRAIPGEALADTTRWLSQPEGWEKNGGGGPASDKLLARVQFTAALASAVESGQISDKNALIRAADRLARDQAQDGSWRIDEQGRVGSPATYGRALASWSARESLRAADPDRFRESIERADAWLGLLEPSSLLEASTLLLADSAGIPAEHEHAALGLLRRGQALDGGWGPYEKSAPEVFDTALALLALDRHRDRPGVPSMIAKGRAYLIENQGDDGSWAETTRPAGAESYAQRLSTTGWATLALLTVKAP